jgi:hypothetical protein
MLTDSLALKTATKMRLASTLYRALKSIRSFAGATDVARVRRNGLRWELDLREGVDLAIFAFGSFERETAFALKKLVTPGSTVLDIGANIGAYTLNLGRLVGPTGKVYAFEVTNYGFCKLKRNLALNPEISARVVAEQCRLTSESKLGRSLFQLESCRRGAPASKASRNRSLDCCSDRADSRQLLPQCQSLWRQLREIGCGRFRNRSSIRRNSDAAA